MKGPKRHIARDACLVWVNLPLTYYRINGVLNTLAVADFDNVTSTVENGL